MTEELGIHMPRAITGAFSEIVPAIGDMGTALVAVFAVKELVEFGKKLYEIEERFDGVAAAESRAHEIGKENLSLLEKEVEGNKKMLLGELTRAQFRAITDEADLNALKKSHEQHLIMWGVEGMAYDLVTGKLGEVDEAQGKLTASKELAGRMASILVTTNEKEAKAAEKAAEAAGKHAKAEKDVEFQLFGTGKQLGTYAAGIDGVTKAIDVDVNSVRLWPKISVQKMIC